MAEKHHKAKIAFSLVEKCRDMKEYDCMSIPDIQAQIEEWGYTLKYWTLVDWLYYRTRVHK